MKDYGVRDLPPENAQEGDYFTTTGGIRLVLSGGQWTPAPGQPSKTASPEVWAKALGKEAATPGVNKAVAAAEAAQGRTKLINQLVSDSNMPEDVATQLVDIHLGQEEANKGVETIMKVLGVSREQANQYLQTLVGATGEATDAGTAASGFDQAFADFLASQGASGGGATGMSPEEKQLSLASLALQALAEKGTRERTSVEELGNIAQMWLDTLKRAVTPEEMAQFEKSAQVPAGTFKPAHVTLEELKQKAEALGGGVETELPQLQAVLKQMLPGFQGGGAINLSADQARQLLQQSGQPYVDPYADPYGLYETNILTEPQELLATWGEQTRPELQQALFEQMGVANPELLGENWQDFGTQYAQTLASGGGYPTLGAQQLSAQTDIENIRASADRDVANINSTADQKVAQIYADANVKAEQLRKQGAVAQANATIAAAKEQARATLEAARIDAANRLAVAQLQEREANKRMGAQLGADWATTSQQMAANPRDFLALAFRQAGYGVPAALQNFLQPAGGAVPTTKGAPSGLQAALSQIMGT
jgi:hypothetical protein